MVSNLCDYVFLLKLRTRVQLLTNLVETLSVSDVDDNPNVNKQKLKVPLYHFIILLVICLYIFKSVPEYTKTRVEAFKKKRKQFSGLFGKHKDCYVVNPPELSPKPTRKFSSPAAISVLVTKLF